MTTIEILDRANAAKRSLFSATTEQKNSALALMARSILENKEEILAANREDLAAAESISDVMKDRLRLTKERISSMAKGIEDLIPLPDPVGEVLSSVTRPNGLVIKKVSSPMGVIAIIYESRPNVTSDAAALALKSGNVCVLRSGKEAWRTSKAIVNALRSAVKKAGLSEDAVNLIEDTSRESALALMKANGKIDLLIPRGGAGLISSCVENATVPCIQTGTGICHIFVDKSADIEKALSIVENAKTSRPSVCNAEEVLLVHENIAKEFLPKLKTRLTLERKQRNLPEVELRCDEKAYSLIGGVKAKKEDFDTEFLDYILAVKVVKDVFEAVEHIEKHSTHHSESILTKNEQNAAYFTKNVDSAAVYVNASTRFTDGGEFGLGCEMGISTQKLHARGPMGLKELCTYQYIIQGDGQIR